MTTPKQTLGTALTATFCGLVTTSQSDPKSIVMGNVSIKADACAMPRSGAFVSVFASFANNGWHALSIQVINTESARQAETQPNTPAQQQSAPQAPAPEKTEGAVGPTSVKFAPKAFGFGRGTIEKPTPKERPEPRESRFSMPKRPSMPASSHANTVATSTPSRTSAPAQQPALKQPITPATPASPTSPAQSQRRGAFGKAPTLAPMPAVPNASANGKASGARGAFSRGPGAEAEKPTVAAARGTLNTRSRAEVLKAWCLTDIEEGVEDIPY